MSTNIPDDDRDDATNAPDASEAGAALDKRPSAVVVTRPPSGLDRAAPAQGRQLLHAGCGGGPMGGRAALVRGRRCVGWSATASCNR